MHSLKVRVFENLYTTEKLDLYIRIKYTGCIMIGTALNKYCAVFLECKDTDEGYYSNQWTLIAVMKKTLRISELELSIMGWTPTLILSVEKNVAKTQIMSCVSSLGRARGRITYPSFNTIWNIFTIISSIPLG